MNHLCVISDSYPYKDDNSCVFVRDLIVEFAKNGIQCKVVSPQGYKPGYKKRPYHFKDKVSDNIYIDVYSPRFLALSSRGVLMKASSWFHKKSVQRVLSKENIKPNIAYGHFIYHCGITAVDIAKFYNCYSIVVCGESTGRLERGSRPYSTGLRLCNWKKKLSSANDIICVSSENLRLLRDVGYIDNVVKTHVLPNSVNTDVFRHIDKTKARECLGWSAHDFVVAFVGHFIERKGPNRVDDAVSGLEDVRTVFIGSGKFTPHSECLYCGTVLHDEIPKYLCAADAFVLPTTGEGCCNAIIEAICCGLPIISSSNSFNDDILEDSYSIRIDPNDVGAIREAIIKLKNSPEKREQMSKAALEAAPRFSLEARARKIIDIMESQGEGN